MHRITLEAAQQIIAAALEEGARRGFAPLAVAVLDPGSHVIALARQDNASTLRPQIAIAKAAGALGLGISSRRIAEMAADRPTFVGMVGALAPAGMLPAAGGVIVTNAAGEIVGAVGVTGDTSDNDEVCALAGIAAAGLLAKA